MGINENVFWVLNVLYITYKNNYERLYRLPNHEYFQNSKENIIFQKQQCHGKELYINIWEVLDVFCISNSIQPKVS